MIQRTFCIFLLALLISGGVSAQSNAADEKLIMENFNQQVKCWNAGDIGCYCKGYVNSDKTHIVSSGGITYGYDAIVASYKTNWPKERMGKLHFDQVNMEKLAESIYLVHGRYNLEYEEKQPVTGYFTVIMKKIDGKWLMYADHSS